MGNTTSISDPKPVLPRSKRVLCKDQCKCSSEEKKRQREKCMQFKESWMFTNHYKLFASTNRVLCEIYEKMSKFGLTEIDYSLREDSKVELPKDKGYKINSVLIPVSYTHLDVYKRQRRNWSATIISTVISDFFEYFRQVIGTKLERD